MKSVVIVADSSFVVETIRGSLRNAARLKLLGKVDGRASIRTPIRECRPDIVLIDEMQNSEDALERIRECREEAPASSVLLLTMRMDDDWVAKAIRAGADACISKSAHLPSLGLLLHAIVNRHIVSAPPAALGDDAGDLACTEELTAREREILLLVSDGLTNSRIGKQLWVTEQTVKFHLSNIYRKLGVSNRTEASRFVHTSSLGRQAGPQLVPAPQAGGAAPALTPLPALSAAGAA